MFILVILAYSLVALIELIPLYQKGMLKEMTLCGVLTTCAFIISLLLSLGIKVPSPARPIERIVMFFIGK